MHPNSTLGDKAMELSKYSKKSPWILHYNAGSCNGWDIEILAALSPKYDLERFGAINSGNPKPSDIFLVTRPATYCSRTRLVELYNQIPHPKVVVVLGSCTSTGGVFKDMYNVENGIDHYIPGRAASPELIIDGIAQALKRLQKKSQKKD